MAEEIAVKTHGKQVLAAGFHIYWATNNPINKNTKTILGSVTSLSLARTYCDLFQLDHVGCLCYYCHLKQMI